MLIQQFHMGCTLFETSKTPTPLCGDGTFFRRGTSKKLSFFFSSFSKLYILLNTNRNNKTFYFF